MRSDEAKAALDADILALRAWLAEIRKSNEVDGSPDDPDADSFERAIRALERERAARERAARDPFPMAIVTPGVLLCADGYHAFVSIDFQGGTTAAEALGKANTLAERIESEIRPPPPEEVRTPSPRETYDTGKTHCGEEQWCQKHPYSEDVCECLCDRCASWRNHARRDGGL